MTDETEDPNHSEGTKQKYFGRTIWDYLSERKFNRRKWRSIRFFWLPLFIVLLFSGYSIYLLNDMHRSQLYALSHLREATQRINSALQRWETGISIRSSFHELSMDIRECRLHAIRTIEAMSDQTAKTSGNNAFTSIFLENSVYNYVVFIHCFDIPSSDNFGVYFSVAGPDFDQAEDLEEKVVNQFFNNDKNAI